MALKVLAVVGGISKNSLNQRLFRTLKGLKPGEIEFDTFDISTLPFFNQDLESDVPATVREFKKKIADAQAILFITPEYNRSIPGVLKNAIDWGSRPYGQNSWNDKPAGQMGASIGNLGTTNAQAHLRQTLSYLNMHVLGQPEVYLNLSKSFSEVGEMTDESAKKFLAKYLDSFVSWVRRFQ